MKMNPSLKEFYFRNVLDSTNFSSIGTRYKGKARDVYDTENGILLVATDRQSAFDIPWCLIPLKGQVLTQISRWWFKKIEDIAPTHYLGSPDLNVTVVKKLSMLPIEVVVRAYLTGSTATSVWVNYEKGVRSFGGNILPDGMMKNQELSQLIITPTTKAKSDKPTDPTQLISSGVISSNQWDEISRIALNLFTLGQSIAKERGLVLVDTKYEFGIDKDGQITVGDEVHTPDSSRYWLADSDSNTLQQAKAPRNLDKEFFRQWLIDEGFNPNKPNFWQMNVTEDIILILSLKYIELYERLTGEELCLPPQEPIAERIEKNILQFLKAK